MDSQENKRLMAEFPAHTYDAWKEAAVELLKGRSFEKTLITPTYEGFDIEPVYTREALEKLTFSRDLPGMGSGVRGFRAEGYLQTGWTVSQEMMAPTPSALNELALKELMCGVNELNIWLDKSTRGGADADPADHSGGVCGTPVNTAGDWETILKGVDTAAAGLYLHPGKGAAAQYALLLAALRKTGANLAALRGCLGLDPVAWLLEAGESAGATEAVYDAMAALLRHAKGAVPGLQVVEVAGHAYHDAGASSVQEMGAVLATAVAYLKAMTQRGLSAEEVVPRMRISLSVGGNYFIEVAKFRAFRLIWTRVMEAFGVAEDSRAVHIHGRTGLWNKTVFDPYVNMLRTTTEAFSAVVGGVDSLHVSPFDEVVREGDAFSRRIARNTHAILSEECGMRQVVDPAGGSWAVESLTDNMASEAWKQFQKIEAEGGILKSLESCSLQQAVEAVRQEKARNIQRRKDVIVGTNAYPNATEKLLTPASLDYAAARQQRQLELAAWRGARDDAAVKVALDAAVGENGQARVEALVAAAAAGATLAELQAVAGLGEPCLTIAPLKLKRAAAEFEALRIAAATLTAAGKPPRVHQLNMGPSRRYRIRADWTTAFFQVGGIDVLADEDYADADTAVAALKASGASVAIITSDDETYATVVEPLAAAIKAALPEVRILLAGAPGETEAAWRAAGVADFVNVRVNAYTFNRELLVSMGAAL